MLAYGAFLQQCNTEAQSAFYVLPLASVRPTLPLSNPLPTLQAVGRGHIIYTATRPPTTSTVFSGWGYRLLARDHVKLGLGLGLLVRDVAAAPMYRRK